jgi:DNA-binding IclR family transcriptional regulator
MPVAQGSAPTARVVRVLETLRGRAGEGMRYAELADDAGVSQATCHAILTTLADAGYVMRDPVSKSYLLGPAVVGLGEGAARSFPEVGAARAELDDLRARTGLHWSVGKVIGDTITIVRVAADVSDDEPIRPGTRLPFAPPFGAIHVAWSPPSAVEQWIGRAPGRTFSEPELRAVLRDHRQSRFAVAPHTPASVQLRELLGELASDAVSEDVRERTFGLLAAIDRLDYTSDELRNGRALSVNAITAPVFDDHGAVSFAVALHVASPAVEAESVRSLARELVQSVDRVTASIGGRVPTEGGSR